MSLMNVSLKHLSVARPWARPLGVLKRTHYKLSCSCCTVPAPSSSIRHTVVDGSAFISFSKMDSFFSKNVAAILISPHRVLGCHLRSLLSILDPLTKYYNIKLKEMQALGRRREEKMVK